MKGPQPYRASVLLRVATRAPLITVIRTRTTTEGNSSIEQEGKALTGLTFRKDGIPEREVFPHRGLVSAKVYRGFPYSPATAGK